MHLTPDTIRRMMQAKVPGGTLNLANGELIGQFPLAFRVEPENVAIVTQQMNDLAKYLHPLGKMATREKLDELLFSKQITEMEYLQHLHGDMIKNYKIQIGNETADINWSAGGQFGDVFELRIGGERFALKVYDPNITESESREGGHGPFGEIPSGWYFNDKATDVNTLYLGRIPTDNNEPGWAISRFLDDSTPLSKQQGPLLESFERFIHTDTNPGNLYHRIQPGQAAKVRAGDVLSSNSLPLDQYHIVRVNQTNVSPEEPRGVVVNNRLNPSQPIHIRFNTPWNVDGQTYVFKQQSDGYVVFGPVEQSLYYELGGLVRRAGHFDPWMIDMDETFQPFMLDPDATIRENPEG